MHPVRQVFNLHGEAKQDGFNLFGSHCFLTGGERDAIGKIFIGKHELGKNDPEFQMFADSERMHAGQPETTGIFRVNGKDAVALQQIGMRCDREVGIIINQGYAQVIEFVVMVGQV